MEKFKKFCKKPLLISSICIILAFMLGLIIMGCISHADATYTYNSSHLSIEMEIDEDEVTITSTNFGVATVVEYDCLIKNGKLLVREDRSNTYIEYGTINAYKLVLKEAIDATDPSQGYVYTTLKCELTNTLRTINIVMIVVGALGVASSIVYILCEKKKEQTITNTAETSSKTEN